MGTFRLELHVEIDREDDGRWFAVVPEIPGVMVYGNTEDHALAQVKVLALQVVTDRLARGEDLLTGLPLEDDRPRVEYLAALSGVGFTPVPVACKADIDYRLYSTDEARSREAVPERR